MTEDKLKELVDETATRLYEDLLYQAPEMHFRFIKVYLSDMVDEALIIIKNKANEEINL